MIHLINTRRWRMGYSYSDSSYGRVAASGLHSSCISGIPSSFAMTSDSVLSSGEGGTAEQDTKSSISSTNDYPRSMGSGGGSGYDGPLSFAREGEIGE